MNINDLIFRIEVEFKSLINKYQFNLSRNYKSVYPQTESDLRQLYNAEMNFKFIAAKVKEIDFRDKYIERNMQKDLEKYLRVFYANYESDNQKIVSISKTTSEFLNKYKYELANMQKSHKSDRMISYLMDFDSKINNVDEKNEIKSTQKPINGPKIQMSQCNISYNLKEDSYYLNGELIYGNLLNLSLKNKEEFIKQNMDNIDEFKFLFGEFDSNKKKVIKLCDPYILLTLSKIDINMAKDYINRLSGNQIKSANKLNYKITYDIRGIDKIPKVRMSFWQKLKTKILMKRSENAVTVVRDKKKAPWYAVLPMIGAVATTGVVGLISSKSTDRNFQENSYTDTTNPGNEKDTNATEDFSIDTTEDTTYQASTQSYTEMPGAEFDAREDNGATDIKENIESDNNNIEDIAVKIGDKVNISDGVVYTENCLGGGRSGTVGAVSWRPSSEYYIDGVAYMYGGKVIHIDRADSTNIRETIKSIAQANNIDESQIDTSVLLSLVKGIADTGWAKMDVGTLEKNVVQQNDVENRVHYVISDDEIDR